MADKFLYEVWGDGRRSTVKPLVKVIERSREKSLHMPYIHAFHLMQIAEGENARDTLGKLGLSSDQRKEGGSS